MLNFKISQNNVTHRSFDDEWTPADSNYLSDLEKSDWQAKLADDDLSWLTGGCKQSILQIHDINDVKACEPPELYGDWLNHNLYNNKTDYFTTEYSEFSNNFDYYHRYSLNENDDDNFWLETVIEDEINEVLLDNLDNISSEQHGEQIAAQLLYDFDWDKKYLSFLIEIFRQPYQGSTKSALYRAVAKNISPEEIIVAYRIKEYWKNSSHFHISIRNHHVYSKYVWLSWNTAFDILACFEGIPDADEVCFHLEQLFDYWENHIMPNAQCDEFIGFVRSQIHKPVEFWVMQLPETDNWLPINLPELSMEFDRPNAWNIVQNYLHQQDKYLHNHQYLEKNEVATKDETVDEPVIKNPLSAWEQHCEIMRRAACKNLKPFEILKLIPLSHDDWPDDAKVYFKLNGLENVYQALVIIKISDKSIANPSKLLIKKYINEVKKYLGY